MPKYGSACQMQLYVKTGCALQVLGFSKCLDTFLGHWVLDIGNLYRGGVPCGDPALICGRHGIIEVVKQP